jgi:hypothetical protein
MWLQFDLGTALRNVKVGIENLESGDEFDDFFLVQRHMNARLLVESAKDVAFELL